ncbi:glycerophosphoryl diester phosphodiesterase [Spinactinospora alkalitolerans]|uniref:Glycerophosphoryl diester phosphodiesterase n=1 Tax=Spinactinospora alkalitolerans TaxID=687207 RepID=A0A852TYQ9_9ACTN|nr:glycerophosphodiester phosphodiesterase [Spinactinospora alkalitolerans]NYE49696.1 glycerophosphoryl diester phosphodiesterase [Spinactinospora alkalitolerans]
MIFDPPEVIGHRGAGRGVVDGAEENTLASFAAAVAAGAAWVEVDVRRSADDELLVHHDAALPDGRVIVDLPASAAREAGLVTLEEVLDAVPEHIGIDVDVKTVMEDAVDAPSRRTTTLLMPHLKRESRRRRLFVCSFDPAALLAVHEADRAIATAWMPFVRSPLDQAVAGAAGMGCAAVAIDARSFGLSTDEPRPGRRAVARTVDVAHRAGLEVVCWCPGPADSARFSDAGVDALVVDDVPGVLAALKER